MLHTQNCLQNHIKNMLKQPNFFYSQLSTLPKGALAKFYLSTTFVMISSVAPNRSSTFYAYLITKIENRNLKAALVWVVFGFYQTVQHCLTELLISAQVTKNKEVVINNNSVEQSLSKGHVTPENLFHSIF